MPRFSLSPPPKGRDGGGQAGAMREKHLGRVDWDEDDDTDTDSSSSSSDSSGSASTDEEEPPHPLGFPASYGRTRFGLYPPDELEEGPDPQSRGGYAWFDPGDWEVPAPAPSTLAGPGGAGSAGVGPGALMSHHHRRRLASAAAASEAVDDLTERMGRVAALVAVAARAGDGEGGERLRQERERERERRRTAAGLWKLADAAEREARQIRRERDAERARMEAEQERAASLLRSLIARDQREAEEVEERERRDQERAEDAARRRADAEKAEAERRAAAERSREKKEQALRKEEEDQQRQRAENDVARERQKVEAKARFEAEEAKKTEWLTKAKKLTAKLVEVRASLKPFEANKAVSKRRLQFKKVARGKLNTLSHDAEKIRSVTSDIVNAIGAARADDEQVKQQMKETGDMADGGLTPDMTLGKRYLLDLLCSNVIVRVQAEGFNGTRGDGFPLAAMLATASVQVKELVPLLASHFYTACPATMPALPEDVEGDDENALMESLGMLKDKTGEYETFDRFLTRTEGLVSMMAGIMASIPSDHVLMGGHRGAMDWLGRFLDLLPPAPQEPLSLLTAPVLVAFLTGAGKMLANKFPQEFKGHLDIITNDIFKRLDVGTIGLPSATRLKKILEGGFEGFRTTIPPGAVEAYYDAAGGDIAAPSLSAPRPPLAAPAATPFGQSQPFPPQQPLQAQQQPQQQQQQQQQQGGGFASFDATQQQGGGFASFNASQQQQQQQQSPFGSSGASGPAGQPSSNKPPCRFFAQGRCRNGANCKFSHDSPAGGTFGGPAIAAGPYSGPNVPNPSAFGGAGPANPSPFGQTSATASSSFGQAAAPSPSPFGQAAASPFGQTNAPSSSPFGQANAPDPSPFGSTTAPLSSPFGQANAPAAAPFGQTNPGAPTPFGNTNAPTPSPFGQGLASAPTPFGQSSAPVPSPFGSGTSGNLSPFGGSVVNNPSPFGSGAAGRNGFGANASKGSGFGGGRGGNRPPCKFFAQGRCRNGANCKFSHDTPSNSGSSDNSSSWGSVSSPFGGGGAGNTAFGGGGGVTRGGGNSFGGNPFGAPRR